MGNVLTSWKIEIPWFWFFCCSSLSCLWWSCLADWRHIVIISVQASILRQFFWQCTLSWSTILDPCVDRGRLSLRLSQRCCTVLLRFALSLPGCPVGNSAAIWFDNVSNSASHCHERNAIHKIQRNAPSAGEHSVKYCRRRLSGVNNIPANSSSLIGCVA